VNGEQWMMMLITYNMVRLMILLVAAWQSLSTLIINTDRKGRSQLLVIHRRLKVCPLHNRPR